MHKIKIAHGNDSPAFQTKDIKTTGRQIHLVCKRWVSDNPTDITSLEVDGELLQKDTWQGQLLIMGVQESDTMASRHASKGKTIRI